MERFTEQDSDREEWLQTTAAGFCRRMVNAWTKNGLPLDRLARMMIGMGVSCLLADRDKATALSFLDQICEQVADEGFPAEVINRPN